MLSIGPHPSRTKEGLELFPNHKTIRHNGEIIAYVFEGGTSFIRSKDELGETLFREAEELAATVFGGDRWTASVEPLKDTLGDDDEDDLSDD